MKIATLVTRILLGLIMVVFGLNGFLHFIPLPALAEGSKAAIFMGGLTAAPYFWPLLNIIKIAAGAALLAGRFIPLALVMLFPIVVNIFLYDLTMDMNGLIMGALVLVLNLFLAWRFKDYFMQLLTQNAVAE
ncbi:hypothetical protein N9933_00930 [bacterium]|nr:hypothetical protein [bacterium]